MKASDGLLLALLLWALAGQKSTAKPQLDRAAPSPGGLPKK